MEKRYILEFHTQSIKKHTSDIIIGSGIAGLFTALNIDKNYKITILSLLYMKVKKVKAF